MRGFRRIEKDSDSFRGTTAGKNQTCKSGTITQE
jgi:hypothetical protein